jgi:hypothetical protein
LSSAASAAELWLAPGKSVTVFDAADPSVRLVITAPPQAPLDLGALLELKPGESVHSLATQVQLRRASALTATADGTLALNSTNAPPPSTGQMLEGGVLVREGSQWRLYPADPASAAKPAAAPADLASGQRTLISKAGVTSAQAQRDIQQCRSYGEQAAAQFLRSSEKVAAYNSAMHSCLRGFGYAIHSPAA